MEPVKVFVSYAHDDIEYRDELVEYLNPLERDGTIESWSDRKLGAGEEWDTKIKNALEEADIILFLVSSDFLASDYIYDIEIKRSMERHDKREAVVIPIIVRPCLWKRAPFAKIQATPIAAGGLEPITKWENVDEAWTNVVESIQEAAYRLREKSPVVKETKRFPIEPLNFRFNNYARLQKRKNILNWNEEDRWDWMVFVDEPFEKIDMIDNVEYQLHSTFPNPNRKSEDAASRFALKSNGWGTFTIFITITLKNGSQIETSYELSFDKSWPS